MKKLFVLLGMLISIEAYAQFPVPRQFEFNYAYIHLNEYGACAGVPLSGPAYCSHFKWSKPETSTTTAKLVSYNLYYQALNSQNISLLKTLSDTLYNELIGIMGKIWVTAIYSNPSGESLASNIVENSSLPIGIENIELPSNGIIYYDKQSETICLKNSKIIEVINVFNLNGIIVKTVYNKTSVTISEIPSGVYIVEAIDKDTNRIIQKINK